MKRPLNPVIKQPVDYRSKVERTKVEELPTKTCMVCHKATQGYGVFHDGVVCSRKCNDTFMASRPSLIDYQPGERNEHQVVHRPVSHPCDEPDAIEGTDT